MTAPVTADKPPGRPGRPARARPTIKLDLSDLHPGQVEVIEDDSRFKVVVCGRRWGKTSLGVLICLIAALQGKRVWWVAPIYTTAGIGWSMLKWLARQLPSALRPVWSESERRMTIPFTGGSVTIKSAHDPDSLRGEGLDGVVFDEAAYVKRIAWTNVIRPMLIDTGGWAIFMSTPAGRNWFADLYDRGLSRPGWRVWQKPTSDNPRIPQSELDEALEDMGADVFAQEHGAQFLDSLGTVFRAEDRHYFAVELEGRMPIFTLLDGGKRRTYRLADLDIFATVDPALSERQTADYTAIGVFGMTRDADLLVLEIQRVRAQHSDVVALLATTELRWRPQFIGVEKSSIGLGIIQDALRAGVNVQPLTADRDKVTRARPVSIRMRNKKVWLDAEAPWLRAFETELLAFPNGDHDDQVDVLAYADSYRHAALGGGVRVLEEETQTALGWRRVDDGGASLGGSMRVL